MSCNEASGTDLHQVQRTDLFNVTYLFQWINLKQYQVCEFAFPYCTK